METKYVELAEGRCECVVDWCYCFVWKAHARSLMEIETLTISEN